MKIFILVKPPLCSGMSEQGFMYLVQRSRMAFVNGKRKEEVRMRKAVDRMNANEFRLAD